MKPRSVVLFLAIVLGLLLIIGVAFPKDGISIGKIHLRFPQLHSLIEKPEHKNIDLETTTESQEMLQLRDSIAWYQFLVDSSELRFWLPKEDYFDPFWIDAENARESHQTVRVVHYGDSQIEMDRISSQLRSYMQETFGGGGPGLIPFRTIIPTYAVGQYCTGDLTHLSSFGDSTVVRSSGNYGPMMQSFRLHGQATVSIKAATQSWVDDRVKHFSKIGVLYNRLGDTINISLMDVKAGTTFLPHFDGTGRSKAMFFTDSTTESIRLKVNGYADMYGIMVDDGDGVAVDNVPMRGCSGQQFTLVNEELLIRAYTDMNVGLIIMQFGGNSVPYLHPGQSISAYCNSIGKQIDYLHQCCPKARILFVGPSDMSTRINGEMRTYPVIPELIDSLAVTALKHHAAYWSIYHAMGGLNSMPEWNRQGLAGQDYIHFSQRGADLMGDRLATAFQNSYSLYCLKKKMKMNKEEKE